MGKIELVSWINQGFSGHFMAIKQPQTSIWKFWNSIIASKVFSAVKKWSYLNWICDVENMVFLQYIQDSSILNKS
jgi:hypothetical protein